MQDATPCPPGLTGWEKPAASICCSTWGQITLLTTYALCVCGLRGLTFPLRSLFNSKERREAFLPEPFGGFQRANFCKKPTFIFSYLASAVRFNKR